MHYLRNVADADALIAAIAECKAAGGKVGVQRCDGLCSLAVQLASNVPWLHLLDTIC